MTGPDSRVLKDGELPELNLLRLNVSDGSLRIWRWDETEDDITVVDGSRYIINRTQEHAQYTHDVVSRLDGSGIVMPLRL